MTPEHQDTHKTQTLMIIPVSENVGLSMTTFGIVDAIKSSGVSVSYFKPIAFDDAEAKSDFLAVNKLFSFSPPQPLSLAKVFKLLGEDRVSEILEEIVNNYVNSNLKNKEGKPANVTVIQGLHYDPHYAIYTAYLNQIIARTFSAKVILVATQQSDSDELLIENLKALTHLCRASMGLNVLGYVVHGTSERKLSKLDRCVYDRERLGSIIDFASFSDNLDDLRNKITQFLTQDWIPKLLNMSACDFLSPPFFLHRLVDRAFKLNKRIVLPEGAHIRTICAAIISHERRIARCVLLGGKYNIMRICQENNLTLPKEIEIIEPPSIADRYVQPMVALRQHKGMTEAVAKELLLNNTIVLGTMMLQQGDVDGMVSGALHTTPETVRPALQLIRTTEHDHIVSSAFFMCLPKRVVLYADCAVNRNPSVEDLAEIAIQTAETAVLFGISPRVAMLSYSTDHSGSGADVEKIIEAVRIVNHRKPDLMIEGPLQYDAATDPVVAQLKSPESKIEGMANVFIFPNLNTGNIVYKAVQRTNNIICIGPVLQGLRLPVNDLSRGASPSDIAYTIAVTAIQAEEKRL